MKVRSSDQSFLGRFVLLVLMGGPIWAASLALDENFRGSLLIVVLWVLLSIPLVMWLAKERVVRISFSLAVVTIMTIIYSLVLYGSWST